MALLAICLLVIAGVVGYKDYSGYCQLSFVVDIETSHPGGSQVFFDVGRGYNEQDSYSIPIQLGKLQKYIFPLSGKKITAIRFDPVDISAVVRIKDARIENNQGDIIKKFLLGDFRPIQQIDKMDTSVNTLVIRTAENAKDPILEIANSSIDNHITKTDYIKKRGWIIIGFGLLCFLILLGLNYLIIFSFRNQYIIKGVQCLKEYIDENPKKCVSFIIGFFAAILFAIKLWLIGTYGNATPFWDQWDAEAANLYKPFIDGTISFSDFLAPHNEHRIFTARVLSLALLYINGIWNPLLQMVVNAGLHISTLVLCIVLFARVIGRNYLPALLVFSLILFGIPYAWENTLCGFQSQFYFVILFCIACMWLITTRRILSLAWWCGIGFAALAFFSLASGVFALAATAATGITLYALNIRRDKVQLITIIILIVMMFGCILFTPTISGHASLKAKSFIQLYNGFLSILSWPLSGSLGNLLLRNLPVIILGAWVIRYRPPATEKIWFFVALAFWMGGQALSIAYGRNVSVLSSRYLDLFAIGVLLNFACLLWLCRIYLHQHYCIVVSVVYIWIIAIASALGTYVMAESFKGLPDKKFIGMAQETNTRAFLLTGDFKHLKDKPHGLIPYPNPERLALILASQTIQAILPTNIRRPLTPISFVSKPADAFVIDGYHPTTPKRTGMAVGSYGIQGDAATGQASIRFDGNKQSALVAIPVAGYPLSSGINIEIEQNGHRKPTIMKSNPKESWGIAYVKVHSGAFSIQITDSSTTAWVAIGAPLVVGRLDAFINGLLAIYYVFVVLGLMAGVLLLTHSCLTRLQTKSSY